MSQPPPAVCRELAGPGLLGPRVHRPPIGQAQRLTVDLRHLGVGRATARLFADSSSTDGTLRTAALLGSRFELDTAPFGGFPLVI